MRLSRRIRRAAAQMAAATALISAGPASAAAVSWTSNSNGLWTAPNNWSSSPNLPGSGDVVNIDRPLVSLIVTLDSGTQSITSLTCAWRCSNRDCGSRALSAGWTSLRPRAAAEKSKAIPRVRQVVPRKIRTGSALMICNKCHSRPNARSRSPLTPFTAAFKLLCPPVV